MFEEYRLAAEFVSNPLTKAGQKVLQIDKDIIE